MKMTMATTLLFNESLSLKTFADKSDDQPLIHYVNQLIKFAIQQSASDVHIEPYQQYCRIRYRCDGILFEMTQVSLELASRISMRLKIIANLDIAERRLPQDGRFKLYDIDIRINTCPTLHGEKIVLRLLNHQPSSLTINTLGFNAEQNEIFLRRLNQPHGMILVTGPTGSGKTTTLYTALHYLNSSERNISTIEDPIEIQLNGINQVNLQPKIGLDYLTTLRSFLRQDPDIIMLGEIRDADVADIAIQAAQTGHLILSTLHTNSAVESLVRLQSMGIAHYKIAGSLSLVIAQRLLRKLCNHCKTIDPHSEKILKNLNCPAEIPLFQANGCQQCLNGYQGRMAIYEMLEITHDIAEAILSNQVHFFDQFAKRQGMKTLHQAGIEKVLLGLTSLTELNRVLFT